MSRSSNIRARGSCVGSARRQSVSLSPSSLSKFNGNISFFSGNTSFGPMDIGALAMFWLIGAGASDVLAMYRSERWGIYAEAEPRLLVLARVAVGHPSEVTVLSPAGLVALNCAMIAASARLLVAFDAIGVTSPALPPGAWWVALISAAFLDILTVSLSVGAWMDGQTAVAK